MLILIRPQRGILIRMLFGINGGGDDTLSTTKYTSPKMQAEHRAVKRSPARVTEAYKLSRNILNHRELSELKRSKRYCHQINRIVNINESTV